MALRSDLRVLVVDDMSVSRQVLFQLLEHFGMRQVRTAAGCEAALAELARAPADMVISDLAMPGADGVALLSTLRGRAQTRGIRFVLTTGHEADPRLQQARRLGIDAILTKPFRAARVLDCVEEIAGRI